MVKGKGMGRGMVATPSSGRLGLLRTTFSMSVILLFHDFLKGCPKAGLLIAPTDKTVGRVGAALAFFKFGAYRHFVLCLAGAGTVAAHRENMVAF